MTPAVYQRFSERNTN